ncbi:MAG: hypothetical protein ACJA2W_000216 [Planctomycetota bacterium]|jgi:hypothetical protein
MKRTAVSLFLALALLPACGGSKDVNAAAGHGPGVEVEGEVESEHYLSFTVDGTRFEARGTPFGPSISFAAREINVQIGGPLTSAVAAGKSVSLGDYDIKMNLLVNSVEPGVYQIVSRRNAVTRGDEPKAFAEFFFPESAAVRELRPVSGTLTVEEVDGRDDDGRYRLMGTSGRFEGQFADASGAQHQVMGEFEYVR